MRRKNPSTVTVKAPSRGLVTRLPSEIADLFNPATPTTAGDGKRVCVVAENVRFENGTCGNAPGTERVSLDTSLLASMVSHWKLNEVGETRYDSHGSLDLLDPANLILSGTGKFGNAALLAGDLGGFGELQITDGTNAAALALGGTDSTICFWAKFSAVTDSDTLIYKASDFTEYVVSRVNDTITFTVGDAATGLSTTTLTSASLLSAGVWYFIAVRHKTGGSGLLSIRINATNLDGPAYTAGMFSAANAFTLGPSTSSFLMDSLSVWRRKLSNAELDTLYNAGSGLDYPFLGGAVSFAYQANLIADPATPLILGTSSSLYLASRTFTTDPRTFNLSLSQIYTGASADSEFRWSAANFFDKVVLAQDSIVPQYWVSGSTKDLPGLSVLNSSGASDDEYTGVFSFANHLILWRDDTITWSDDSDFTNWIPVASTVSSLRLTLTSGFVQPAVNGTTGWIDVTESTAGLTVGQYVRIDDVQGGLSYYNFYLVSAVAPSSGLTATTVAGGTQTVAASSTTKIIGTSPTAWQVGQRVVCGADTNILTVADVTPESATVVALNADSPAMVASPTTIDIVLNALSTDFAIGDFISMGPTTVPGNDIFEVMGTSVASSKTVLTIRRTALGTNVKAIAGTYLIGSTVVKQPRVSLTKSNAGTITVSASTAITEKYAVQLTLQNLTGITAPGATIAAGKIIATLDANSAGEASIIGDEANGPIFQGIALSDYAFLFKERSVTLLQDVGRQSGTFFARTVLTNEGLISRNALVKVGNGKFYFLGHKNFYEYSGGTEPTPIALQYIVQLYEELDRSHLESVSLFHNERKNEIWICYPTISAHKVLVFNYLENTVSIDTYSETLAGFATAASIDWIQDPAWSSFPDSTTWDLLDSFTSWAGMVGGGKERQSLLCAGDGSLWIHGNVYSRRGLGYTALCETLDFDLDDPMIVKYLDLIQPNFDVRVTDNQDRLVYVTVGSRMTLDAPITWSTPASINIRGGANALLTKVNIRSSGRFFRIRFSSDSPNVTWKISSFNAVFRAGGTY